MGQASTSMNRLLKPKETVMLLNNGGASAMPRRSIATLVSMAILASMVVGCSEGVERVRVSGQVLIDGEPVTAGFIRVYPKGVRDSSSNLDAEGRFELRSYKPGDGVALGTHIVTVNGSEMLSPNQKKWHAPPGYSRISSSGLKLEVTGSTEDAVIELTWGKGKPFIQKMNGGGQ